MNRSWDELIALPKVGRKVKSTPKKIGHAQVNLSARAEDGTRFAVFVRVLLDLPESFSIGLVSQLEDGAAVLLRVNGDHGPHGNEDGAVFDGPHIHRPSAAQSTIAPPPGATPRHADRIEQPGAISLPAYWHVFKQLVQLTVSKEVDDAVGGIYAKSAQLEFFDGHGNTETGGDEREPGGDPSGQA